MALTPPHWCSPPEDLSAFNLTEEEIVSLTIPLKEDNIEYESCFRYDVNFTEVRLCCINSFLFNLSSYIAVLYKNQRNN